MIFCCILAFNLDFNQSHNSFFLKTKLCYEADVVYCSLNKTRIGFLFIFSIFISRNYFSSHFHHFPILLLECNLIIESYPSKLHHNSRVSVYISIMPNCQCSIIFFCLIECKFRFLFALLLTVFPLLSLFGLWPNFPFKVFSSFPEMKCSMYSLFHNATWHQLLGGLWRLSLRSIGGVAHWTVYYLNCFIYTIITK